MSARICTIDRIVVDVREPVPCLSTLGGGGEGICLHETAQLRIIPAGVVEVDITFLHLTGVGVVGWGSASRVARLARGIIIDLGEK
ncbi:MAG: hypothetical protein ACOYKD_07380 [Anaerolineaceae bacterium]